MSHRFRSSCVALVIVSLTVLPAIAQPQTLPAEGATPRTPWGDPDLQGLWNNFTITPLERPEAFADQEFLSAEEVAALEREAIEGVNRANAPSQVRTEPLPVGGNVGNYNSYWTEQGTRVVPTGRTSLIIDSPNGRLPSLTPEGLSRITSPANRRLADVQDGRVPADGPEEMGLSERCLWYAASRRFPPDTTTTSTSCKHPTGW